VRIVILPLQKKIALVEKCKWLKEIRLVVGESLCKTRIPYKLLDGDVAFLRGSELRETNLCVLWFVSLSCISSIFDLLPLHFKVCLSCVHGSTMFVRRSFSSVGARSQDEVELFVQVLCVPPV
jgi:hypothetical protein